MTESQSPNQEAIGDNDVARVSHILTIGQRRPLCQVCTTQLHDGEPAIGYAIRDFPHTPWQIGQLRCVDHPLSLDALSTLGVCEFTAVGRMGRVVDQANQCDWLAFLVETIEAISPQQKSGAAEPPGQKSQEGARKPRPHTCSTHGGKA